MVVVLSADLKTLLKVNRLFGKIWINPQNGCVLKIEWFPYGVQNRDEMRMRSFLIHREPKLKFISEFKLKKGNVRFPSRCVISETYQNNHGDIYTRINTMLTFRDYQFFFMSVSSETVIDSN